MARILVIDDENNIRMMVRLALKYVRHEVGLASDGVEGLETFYDGKRWDLVLLDQRMPGMEGLDVLREIRKRDPLARVIMITAFGTIDLAVDAMKAGATDFLRKPFTAEVLRGAVKAALAGPAEPSGQSLESASAITFGVTTLNGFHVEFNQGEGEYTEGQLVHRFTVRNPEGISQECKVVLPAYIIELVKAHVDREEMPGRDRFWQALCEETLANYLWQHAEFPIDGIVQVEELTSGQKRWIDSVLSGTE